MKNQIKLKSEELKVEQDEGKDVQSKKSNSKRSKTSKQKLLSPFANLFENRKPSNTQAYMLVYIRDEEREKIL